MSGHGDRFYFDEEKSENLYFKLVYISFFRIDSSEYTALSVPKSLSFGISALEIKSVSF